MYRYSQWGVSHRKRKINKSIKYRQNGALKNNIPKLKKFFSLFFVEKQPICWNCPEIVTVNLNKVEEAFTQDWTHFRPMFPFFIPLKTSENSWFSDVFREYRKGTLAWNGLILGETYEWETSQMRHKPYVSIKKLHEKKEYEKNK